MPPQARYPDGRYRDESELAVQKADEPRRRP